MPKYIYEILVPPQAIDELGHVNNVEYVRWMQDAAIAHATAIGCTAATNAIGAAWVARTHHIEYLRPAFEGDQIEVRTWIAEVGRASSLRCYEFVRPADDRVLAKGKTDWVFVDASSGRPKGIPAELRVMFVPPDAED